MKSTGIVRKIDQLGRVVIPKEIRRTLRIRVGDPLEIFTDRDGQTIFKKYSPIAELSQLSNEYSLTLNEMLNCPVVICDKDSILNVQGTDHSEYEDNYTSRSMAQAIEKGVTQQLMGSDIIEVVERENTEKYTHQVIQPIKVYEEAIGAVVLLNNNKEFKENDILVLKTLANLLQKHMEY